MAAAAILNCQIRKILLVDGVPTAHTHNCTKFDQNRSFHYGDIAIFQLFQNGRRRHLGFLNS